MGNRYQHFDDFMAEVVKTTDEICGLKILYNLQYEAAIQIFIAILRKGWMYFVPLVLLLSIGPFGFGAALLTFLATPVGIAIALIIGAGAGAALWKIYKERHLPIAIKQVGDSFKGPYLSIPVQDGTERSHHEVDTLFRKACIMLISKAETSSAQLRDAKIKAAETFFDREY